MRVRGDNDPGTFSIEAMPNKPGWCLVRFYENVEEDKQEVAAVWDSMAAAYQEGVQSA